MDKCGACAASIRNSHKCFVCMACKDPYFFLCANCEPMSMTYHHWRHSFLLIENNDSQKQLKAPNFIANTITNFKLNGKQISWQIRYTVHPLSMNWILKNYIIACDWFFNELKTDEAYNTVLAKKHKEKCDCCFGSIHGIKYQSVPISTSEKKVILCDSCFNLPHRLDDPHWSQIFLWMKIRSLFMLTQQPLRSFEVRSPVLIESMN